ncbi:Lipid-A-disaccharide synthase [Elusimicrobium minutum Pei191]|uniref:Lipid-A-disaccharide synthase n=1 Tax=Elusimicrobium minutum (strain Pei191) TaxID=445932 RepID=B2KEW0_ELUMP|nr:lipid-A-disaccharide synthase [Elusimicrobium minutum]ACC99056.1 Lipid-A-disaccharide synthase [Elusimicrobium minutum Pei191]
MPNIVPTSKNILVVAGDVSGDLHASNLVREIKRINPNVKITALGGKRLKETADNFLFDLASKGASGFVAPLVKLPLWIKLLKMVRGYLDSEQPACVIVVDFYGFNSQVLGMAKHRNIPCYYYVAPQVWASRHNRTKTIASSTKKVITIFPFEPAFHAKYGSNAVFLGNPLLDIVPQPKEHVFDGTFRLGILPGSRVGELTKHTDLFYKTFKEVQKIFPNTKAYLFCVPEFSDEFYLSLIKDSNPQVTLVRETDYKERGNMDFLITCSGTATLENALLGVPMLVAYKMSSITFKVAKAVIKVPYISLVNILAGKEVVKEFIQHFATAKNLSAEVMSYFQNPQKTKKMREQLLNIRKTLGDPGVAKRAAELILNDVFANKKQVL